MAAIKKVQTARGTPATPEQVLIYGHIAATIRQCMEARSWKMADLNVAIGRKPDNTLGYVWINAKGAPSPVMRAKLALALNVPESDLTVRNTDGGEMVKAERIPRGEALPPPPVHKDVLTFSINTEGQARIRFDFTMAAAKGAALLRILMDAGLALGTPDTE